MSAIASTQTGNWSSGSTWVGGSPPGDGDTAVLNHAVSVDAETIIGESAATGASIAITINTGGSLSIAANQTLHVRGEISLAGTSAGPTLAAGATLNFDTSQASSPGSQTYTLSPAAGHTGAVALITCNGTVDNHCIVTATSGQGVITFGSNYSGATIGATYTDFSNLSSVRWYYVGNPTFTLNNCTINNCGAWDDSGTFPVGATFTIANTTFSNSSGSQSIKIGCMTSRTSGNRIIYDSVFDKEVEFTGAQDFDIQRCVFAGRIDNTQSGSLASVFSQNLVHNTTDATMGVCAPFISLCLFTNDDDANPHFVSTLGASVELSQCVFYNDQDHSHLDSGDCLVLTNGTVPNTAIIGDCIGLPSPGRSSGPGQIVTGLGGANNTAYVRNCTWYDYGALFGENYAGHPGMLSEFRDNLIFHDTPNGGTSKITGYGGVATDLIYAASAHHNAGYNLAAQYPGLKFSSGTPGTSDVNGQDPQFVDDGRNPQRYAAQQGDEGAFSAFLAGMMARNAAGWNSSYDVLPFIRWIQEGFVPQNAAYVNTDSTGTMAIGAMDAEAASQSCTSSTAALTTSSVTVTESTSSTIAMTTSSSCSTSHSSSTGTTSSQSLSLSTSSTIAGLSESTLSLSTVSSWSSSSSCQSPSSASTLCTSSQSATSQSTSSSMSQSSPSTSSTLSASSLGTSSTLSASSLGTSSTLSASSESTSSTQSASSGSTGILTTSSSCSGTDQAIGVRSLTATIQCSVTASIKNVLDDGEPITGKISNSLINKRITTGIATDKATRAWQLKSETISSGGTLDIDLYDFAGVDVGAGLGRDHLGQLMVAKQIVGWMIKQSSGAGRLEIMATQPSNYATWVPSMTVALGNALKSGSSVALIQPASAAMAVTDASSHMLRLGANGGNVTFNLYILARHYGTGS